MNKHAQGFQHLTEKFPILNYARIKKGIFIEPQIR